MHGSLTFTDDWTLTEDQLRSRPATGTLFTTSNGYVGVRGGAREPVGERGLALVSGCYETRPYAHPERSYAIPERAQTIVAVTDPTVVAIEVDGVTLSASTGTWLAHRRALDLRTGCVSTDGTWRSPAGATFRITSARLASLTHRELLRTTVTLELISGRARAVELRMVLSANTADRTHPSEPEAVARAHGRVLRPLGTFDEGGIVGLLHATTFSERSVACAAALDTTAGDVSTAVSADHAEHRVSWTLDDAARSVTVEHAAAVADGSREQGTAVLDVAVRAVARHRGEPFDVALSQQRERLERFWTAGRVDLDGAPDVQAAIRYCTFQVFQAEVCRPARAAPRRG